MEEVWSKVLQLLEMEIKKSSINRWFSHIESVNRQQNTVFITVPDNISKEYMEQTFKEQIKSCLYMVTNENLQVVFIDSSVNELYSPYQEPVINTSYNYTSNNQTNTFRFNPRYTFDTFVVGSSNRFAHAAAMAVAERPSRTYNPLFIYGGSGLGKTHLMHAIAQSVLTKEPNLKVVYISTESFTNEFISLVRMGKAHTFKNRYRTCDVFLIDDIQFLTGKEGTQEEFFHTFNTLHEAGKQIVISSDRPPKEIEMLEERLRSRFEWGLITDMQPPDLETRCAILQRKAYTENMAIADDVIFFIADKIKSNIRELEGALNKVIHYATLNKITNIEVTHALDAIKDLLPQEVKAPLNIEFIQKTVAEHFNISIEDMKSKKRDRFLVYPRQISMYLCRDILDVSLPKIGSEFGSRDHTTVIYACDKIGENILKDKELEKTISVIRDKLLNR